MKKNPFNARDGPGFDRAGQVFPICADNKRTGNDVVLPPAQKPLEGRAVEIGRAHV